jgi:hypothetical protein
MDAPCGCEERRYGSVLPSSKTRRIAHKAGTRGRDFAGRLLGRQHKLRRLTSSFSTSLGVVVGFKAVVPPPAPPRPIVENTRTIELDRFVPRDQIDPRYYNTPYYIAPRD